MARAEIFFAGLKKNRVRTDGGRTFVAYSNCFEFDGILDVKEPSAPITIGMIVNLTFHFIISYLNSQYNNWLKKSIP